MGVANKKKINESRFEVMIGLAVNALDEQKMKSLPSDDGAGNTHIFSELHETRMRKLLAKERRREVFANIRSISYRAAAVFIILAATLFGALLFNDDVRDSVRRAINQIFTVEVFDEFVQFTGVESAGYELDWDGVWLPTHLPDGFVLTEDISVGMMSLMIFENADGDDIMLSRSGPDGVTGIDNEQRVHRVVYYGGVEYHKFVSWRDYYPSSILWAQDGFAFLAHSHIDIDELFRVVLSVGRQGGD